jgi:cytochrome c
MSRFRILVASMFLFAFAGPATAEDDDGKIAFNNHCRMCHSFKKDDNRLGPSVHGIFGAKAGLAKGFRGYSGSFTGIIWDEAMLDKLIANPSSISTSTNMIYPPVADAAERKKIIEFLKSLSAP